MPCKIHFAFVFLTENQILYGLYAALSDHIGVSTFTFPNFDRTSKYSHQIRFHFLCVIAKCSFRHFYLFVLNQGFLTVNELS